MCGRFTLEKSIGDLGSLFEVRAIAELPARYNIAPTQPIVAIRQAEAGDEREWVLLRWGLIPAWAREPAAVPLLINARAETAAGKPAFRAALRRRRCLVPADGFYEWQGAGSQKQPFHMRRRDGAPFALAGLWERWEGPEGAIDSCALLTTASNELMRPIHERMPVILDPQDFELWLDPGMQDVEMLQGLLRPYPAEAMVAYPVSRVVNNARNDDPQCVLPLESE
jgi:putative SOS response-associated peptidase YedK